MGGDSLLKGREKEGTGVCEVERHFEPESVPTRKAIRSGNREKITPGVASWCWRYSSDARSVIKSRVR